MALGRVLGCYPPPVLVPAPAASNRQPPSTDESSALLRVSTLAWRQSWQSWAWHVKYGR